MDSVDFALGEGRPGRGGWVAVGWVGFALLVAFLGVFGYKFWFYYSRISRGEAVDAPQFAGRFTAAEGLPSVAGAAVADRAALERAGFAGELGTPGAPLTIVEFADFECPYSKEASTAVRRVMAKYGDRVRFVYRDFPLTSIHPDAAQAAVAARCAGYEGKFWAYHDRLYANDAHDFASLKRYATEAGLVDLSGFVDCLAANGTKKDVDADTALAKAAGVEGTPTFFFNGEMVEGAIPEEALERAVMKLTR